MNIDKKQLFELKAFNPGLFGEKANSDIDDYGESVEV